MTIKRRLFISNIVMIVLPMILTITMAMTAVLVFLNMTNTPLNFFDKNIVTYVSESESEKLLQKDGYTIVTDELVAYKSDSQSYLVVFPDNVSVPNNPWEDNHLIPFLVFMLLIVLVYFTNLTLTRHIFQSIMSPIDTLVNGVHEIRDGNLTYRIEYKNNDEFAAICSDFNEMAARLLDMVNQRQKDEQNQKELLAGISHDLRTPLTSIKSYVKGLRDGVAKGSEKENEYLDVIYRKTCEMEGLIDQLFLFSKLETGNFPFHFKPVSIHKYIVTLLDSLAYDLRDSHASITLNSSCGTQKVLLDGVQMRRVLSNILDNSVKHNKDREIHIDAALYQEGSNVIIRLQDDGKGVSDQQLSRMFDIFYRGDEARSNPSSGSGLGLSITKKIVTAHGGKITAETSDGLAVIIELPIEMEGRT